LIDRVAAIRASVHTKLLAGFLCGAVLLVAMAGLSVAVINHMADRVAEINMAQDRLDSVRALQYLVIAQSHYRAMSLMTHDQSNVDNVARAKADLLTQLDTLDAISPPGQGGTLARVREINQRFDTSGEQVLALYRSGQDAEAMQVHLTQEHPISHEIDAATAVLLDGAVQQMDISQAAFDSDQHLFTWLVLGFSALADAYVEDVTAVDLSGFGAVFVDPSGRTSRAAMTWAWWEASRM